MNDGYSFLMWAYNIVWIGLIAYILFLVTRLGKVSDRIARLERQSDRD